MIVGALLLGFAGAGALQLAYYAVRESWPLAYAALVDTYAITLPQRLWRVTLFRVIPTFVASSALIVTSWRLEVVDWATVTLAIGLHLILTNVRAVLVTLFRAEPAQRVNYTSYHLVAVVLVVVAALAGAVAAPFVGDFIPRPTDLVQNLWFAGFVAVIAAVLFKASSHRVVGQLPFDVEYFVWRANRDVGVKLLDALYESARRHGVDPMLLRAIMVTEVLQRPRWTRVLERIKGRLFPAGSYGVMQVSAPRPISDVESIESVAANLSGTWAFSISTYPSAELPPYLSVDDAVLWTAAGRHNGEATFIENVADVYRNLFYVEHYEWVTWSAAAKVVEFRRYADRIAVRMVTNAAELQLLAGHPIETRTDSGDAGVWRAVEIDLPSDANTFTASVDGTEFEPVDLNVVARARPAGA